jgi:alpha,alpha-trehalase
MNRYYDNKITPRPESLDEDTETAGHTTVEQEAERLYLHLRAGAESGWDFSSRWFSDPNDIRTIHTADIIPVDLNALLYNLEITIAESYSIIKQSLLAGKFKKLAMRRKMAINKYCWDDAQGFFVDYDFHKHQSTGRLSLAGVFPLYANLATQDQAARVADRIEKDFLKSGGLVSTLETTIQQWDSPNGWAPLHWVAIKGLRNYGFNELADKIKLAWIDTNMSLYKSQHKLVEKYNVVDKGIMGGGGEYPLQDGFGWTNGVLAALLSEDK